MFSELSLAPRYCLDDISPWLKGIDPLRRYWICVNGDRRSARPLSGLVAQSTAAFNQAMHSFNNLAIGQSLTLPGALNDAMVIHRVALDCYAIADRSTGAEVWHLFDPEALESLLLTAHPDWQCASEHLNLGRSLVTAAWEQPARPKAA